MTAIQIAVAAALVFLAAAAVVVLIVWKRETEMRTNSIRFIEETLMQIRDGLSENNSLIADEFLKNSYEESAGSADQEQSQPHGNISDVQQPVRETYDTAYPDMETAYAEESVQTNTAGDSEYTAQLYRDQYGNAAGFTDPYGVSYPNGGLGAYSPEYSNDYYSGPGDDGEISLDFMDEDTSGWEQPESEYHAAPQEDYFVNNTAVPQNTGRSGRTYTISELETLIKE